MTDWAPLRRALARARSSRVEVPVWWRDDDAIAPTPALDDLYILSEDLGVPVHLAIIPKYAQTALVACLSERPGFRPIVHGWAHENHAGEGQRKSEFPTVDADTLARAKNGLDRLRSLFGNTLFPIFVPPWNRADAGLVHHLNALGYIALSMFGARGETRGLPVVNTHMDPVFWRGDRGLVPVEHLVEQAANRINARTDGLEDASEPLGYLTHHLVHTPEINEFSRGFISEMLAGGAVVADLEKDIT